MEYMRKMVIPIVMIVMTLVCFTGFTKQQNKYFFTTISNSKVSKIELSFADAPYKKILSRDEKTRVINLLKIVKKENMLAYGPPRLDMKNKLTLTIFIKPKGSILIVPMNNSSYSESFIYKYGNNYFMSYQPSMGILFKQLSKGFLQRLYPQNLLFGSNKINPDQIKKVYLSSRWIHKTLLSSSQKNEFVNILNQSEKNFTLWGFAKSSGDMLNLAFELYTDKNYKITISPYDSGYLMHTVIGLVSDSWETTASISTLIQDVENIHNSKRFIAIKSSINQQLADYKNDYKKILTEINKLEIAEDHKNHLLAMFTDHADLSPEETQKQLDSYYERVVHSKNQGRYFTAYYNACDVYLLKQTKALEEFENMNIKNNAPLDTTESAIH